MRDYYYRSLGLFSSFFNFILNKNLRVLAYHDIKCEDKFRKHITFLKDRYNIISIDQVNDHLFKNSKLPPRALLITFDDGDYSVLKKGLPVLKDLDIPSCLFIITSLINTNNDFWFSAVRKEEKKIGKRPEEINILMNRLKSITNAERIEKINTYSFLPNKQLTTNDLLDLKNGSVFIGNHSHTHPMFDKCSKEEINEEFRMTSKKFDEFQLQEGYKYFAYPNGNWDLVSEECLELMEVKMAFLFDHKINSKKINPLRISRIRTNSDMNLSELKVKVSGLHSFLQNIKKTS